MNNPSDRTLRVGVCIEDVDACIIILTQMAAGHVFGIDQKLQLILQGSNLDQLEEVCTDLHDCAYPLVTGVSAQQTLGDVTQPLDAVVVVLASRCTAVASTSEFQSLVSLVTYIHDLSSMLRAYNLANTKILVTGSCALTAASLLSYRLKGHVSDTQLLAIDGEQIQNSTIPKLRTRCYGRIHRECSTIKEWWTGIKSKPSTPTFLGTKFLAGRKSSENYNGYFFSTSVDIDGPKQFIVSAKTLDAGHISGVKAESDKALVMMSHLEGKPKEDKVFMANL